MVRRFAVWWDPNSREPFRKFQGRSSQFNAREMKHGLLWGIIPGDLQSGFGQKKLFKKYDGRVRIGGSKYSSCLENGLGNWWGF